MSLYYASLNKIATTSASEMAPRMRRFMNGRPPLL